MKPRKLKRLLQGNSIDQDILDLNGKISVEQAKKIAVGSNLISNKVTVEKIIYFDHAVSPKATLVYPVSYLKSTRNKPELASYIIDATTRKVSEEWNALPSAEVGQGPGCVLQAARNRAYPAQDVKKIFQQVGVNLASYK